LAGAGGGGAECVGAGVVVAQPVGVPVEGEHDGAVQEPVEQGRGYLDFSLRIVLMTCVVVLWTTVFD
jgi:hypothetical protein